jgi:hypothetical protein
MMAMTVVMIVKMSMMAVTQNMKDKKINNDNIIDYIDDDNDNKDDDDVLMKNDNKDCNNIDDK